MDEQALRLLIELAGPFNAGGQPIREKEGCWVCIYCGEKSPAIYPWHNKLCPIERARRFLESRGINWRSLANPRC